MTWDEAVRGLEAAQRDCGSRHLREHIAKILPVAKAWMDVYRHQHEDWPAKAGRIDHLHAVSKAAEGE